MTAEGVAGRLANQRATLRSSMGSILLNEVQSSRASCQPRYAEKTGHGKAAYEDCAW